MAEDLVERQDHDTCVENTLRTGSSGYKTQAPDRSHMGQTGEAGVQQERGGV